MKVDGTVYEVRAFQGYLSARWRYEIVVDGARGKVLVYTAMASYETSAIAEEAGANQARAIAKKLREDLT